MSPKYGVGDHGASELVLFCCRLSQFSTVAYLRIIIGIFFMFLMIKVTFANILQ